MTERDFAIDVVRTLRGAGYEALWAGGCVRDELLGLVPKDYDVATSARPEQVKKHFRRTLEVGASFGVVEVLGPRVEKGHLKVQIATFRSDVGYSDGRRPDAVVFSSAQEDAQRRDFTINGMFFDPLKGELIDYVAGQADLHARVLRAIGNPHQRFEEDKLRLLRAVRIATRFELTIEPQTATAIKAMAAGLPIVSAERIAEEVRQLLVHPRRVRGVRLLHDLGLASPILPELATLNDHVLAALDFIGPAPSFPLAMATLLHEADAQVADKVADRLKLSNAERDRIGWLVEKRRFLQEARSLRPSRLKTIFLHPGIHELLTLHRADALAAGRTIDHVEYCERLLAEWTVEEMNPIPFITGADLKGLHLPQGPVYKELLDAVREAQLDGAITSRDEALGLLGRLVEEKRSGR